MKYKHEVAIQSSKYYKDSQPAEDWYEDKVVKLDARNY